jgi:hypothetical protein
MEVVEDDLFGILVNVLRQFTWIVSGRGLVCRDMTRARNG